MLKVRPDTKSEGGGGGGVLSVSCPIRKSGGGGGGCAIGFLSDTKKRGGGGGSPTRKAGGGVGGAGAVGFWSDTKRRGRRVSRMCWRGAEELARKFLATTRPFLYSFFRRRRRGVPEPPEAPPSPPNTPLKSNIVSYADAAPLQRHNTHKCKH